MHHVGPLPLSYLLSHPGYASCIWQELYFLIPLWLQKKTSPPAFSLQSHLSFLCPPVASKGPALGLTDGWLQCKEPSASAPWVRDCRHHQAWCKTSTLVTQNSFIRNHESVWANSNSQKYLPFGEFSYIFLSAWTIPEGATKASRSYRMCLGSERWWLKHIC